MQEAAEQFAIRVRDLVVGFRRHVVIDHLSLDVRRGEILGSGRRFRRRQIGADADHHRADSARSSGEIEVMWRRRSATTTGPRGAAVAMGHPVPAGRAVFVAHRAAEHSVSAAREPRAVGRADGRNRDRQARNGRAHSRRTATSFLPNCPAA